MAVRSNVLREERGQPTAAGPHHRVRLQPLALEHDRLSVRGRLAPHHARPGAPPPARRASGSRAGRAARRPRARTAQTPGPRRGSSGAAGRRPRRSAGRPGCCGPAHRLLGGRLPAVAAAREPGESALDQQVRRRIRPATRATASRAPGRLGVARVRSWPQRIRRVSPPEVARRSPGSNNSSTSVTCTPSRAAAPPARRRTCPPRRSPRSPCGGTLPCRACTPCCAATLLFGHSAEHRPLTATRVGSGAVKVLVWARSDDETAGRAVLRRLRRAQPAAGVELWLVRSVTRTRSARTRQNARGVDSNRTFARRWRWRGRASSSQFPRPARRFRSPVAGGAAAGAARIRPAVTVLPPAPAAVNCRRRPRRGARVRAPGRASGAHAAKTTGGTATSWQNHTFPGTSASWDRSAAGRAALTGVGAPPRRRGARRPAAAGGHRRRRPPPAADRLARFPSARPPRPDARLRPPSLRDRHRRAAQPEGDRRALHRVGHLQLRLQHLRGRRARRRAARAARVCADFVIDRDGTIFQLVFMRLMYATPSGSTTAPSASSTSAAATPRSWAPGASCVLRCACSSAGSSAALRDPPSRRDRRRREPSEPTTTSASRGPAHPDARRLRAPDGALPGEAMSEVRPRPPRRDRVGEGSAQHTPQHRHPAHRRRRGAGALGRRAPGRARVRARLSSPRQRARRTAELSGYRERAELPTPTCASATTATTRADHQGDPQDDPGLGRLARRAWWNGETLAEVVRADRVLERALAADGDTLLFALPPAAHVRGALDRARARGRRQAAARHRGDLRAGFERERRVLKRWNWT